MKSQVSTLSRSFFSSVSASRFLQAIITFYAHHQIKNLILLSIILSRWSFLPRGRCYFFLAIFIKQLAKDVDFERAGLAAFYGPLCLFLYRQRELRQRRIISPKRECSPALLPERTNTIDAIKYSEAKQGEINVGPENIMDAGYNKTNLTAFNIYPSTRRCLCMHVLYIGIGSRYKSTLRSFFGGYKCE